MSQEINEDNYFKTSDLALAASLQVNDCHIEAIDKNDPSKAIFLFQRDEELDLLIQAYWSHQLVVDPMAFFNSLKELKARIYSD